MRSLLSTLALLTFGATLFGQSPIQVTTDPNTVNPYCMGATYGTAPPDEINIYTGVHWHCANQVWTIAGIGQGLILTTTSSIPPAQLNVTGVTEGYVLTAHSGAASFQPSTGGGGSGLNPPASGTGLLTGSVGSQTTAVTTVPAALGYTPAAGGTCVGGGGNSVVQSTSASGVTCTTVTGTGGLASPTSLKGAVIAATGSNSTAVIRLDASLYNTGNNGIANAYAACAAISPTQCIVDIPTFYPGNDTVAGFAVDITQADQSTYSPNVYFNDNRAGLANYYNDNAGYGLGNQASVTAEQGVYYAPQTMSSPNVFFRLSKFSVLAGGHEYNNGQTLSISNYQPWTQYFYNASSGQTNAWGLNVEHIGVGDLLGQSARLIGYGGMSGANTEEGVKDRDIVVGMAGAELLTTVTSGGTNVHTISTATPSQGAGKLGEDRWLYKTTGTISTGSVSAVSASEFGSTPARITASGVSWATSSAIGIWGGNTNPGSATITPSFSGSGCTALSPVTCTGSAASFSPTQLACISDASESEFAYPSAVSGGTVSFTNLQKPHLATALVTTGGLCGMIFDFVADRVTSSTFGSINGNGVTGTLHRFWMVIGTQSSSMLIAMQGKGSYRSSTKWTSSANGYTLWPAAKVAGISTTPGLNSSIGGGPISLADNNVIWTNGDNIAEALGSAWEISGSYETYYDWFPNFSGAGGGGRVMDFVQLAGQDSAFQVNNHMPLSMAIENGGTQTGGYLFNLTGVYQSYFFAQYASEFGDFEFGCPSNGCTGTFHKIWNQTNNTGTDYLFADLLHGAFGFTANNDAVSYTFLADGINMPLVSGVTPALNGTGYGKVFLDSATFTLKCVDSSGTIHACGSGGSSLPPTPGVAGFYVPVAHDTGTSTSTYTATLLNTLPSCSTLSGASTPISGPCIEPSGATGFVVSTRTITATSGTVAATDVFGLITVANSSAVALALPQANLGGNFLPGSYFTVTNYGTGNVTVNASSSLIGPASLATSSRVITGATLSGSGSTFHSCTFVPSVTNISSGPITNYDLKDCN